MMIRMFVFLANWFARNGMEPTQYRITITPLTVDAEHRLKVAWTRDMDSMSMMGKAPMEMYEGWACGIPFEIAEAPR